MKSKDVILIFRGFDEKDRIAELRQLFMTAIPAQGYESTDPLVEFVILSGDGGLSCQPHFGFYDHPRNAVMLWLEPQAPTSELRATLDGLFEQQPSQLATPIRYYVMFSLSEFRIGSVVCAESTSLGSAPHHLSVPQRDAIFVAGGFPAPEPK